MDASSVKASQFIFRLNKTELLQILEILTAGAKGGWRQVAEALWEKLIFASIQWFPLHVKGLWHL